MNVTVPGNLATLGISGDVITISTPVDGSPPTGITTVTIDPNVTLAAVLNALAVLSQVASQMAG